MSKKVAVEVFKYSELSETSQYRARQLPEVLNPRIEEANKAVDQLIKKEIENAGYPTSDIRSRIDLRRSGGVAFYGVISLRNLKRVPLPESLKKAEYVLEHVSFRINKKSDASSQKDDASTMVIEVYTSIDHHFTGSIHQSIESKLDRLKEAVQRDMEILAFELFCHAEDLYKKIVVDTLHDDLMKSDDLFYKNGTRHAVINEAA